MDTDTSPLTVFSTRRCRNTPRVVFALEEVGATYEGVVRDDGAFEREHGRPGPMLRDGDLALFEVNAILRHLARTRGGALWPSEPTRRAEVDAWMDYSIVALRPALLAIMARGDAEARVGLREVLAKLDRALGGRDWLVGGRTIADLTYATLIRLPGLDALTGDLPRFAAWQARLHAAPGWPRAMQRVAALAESGVTA